MQEQVVRLTFSSKYKMCPHDLVPPPPPSTILMVLAQSGKPGTIRETNQGSGILKVLYA